jgi:hypothetical protein
LLDALFPIVTEKPYTVAGWYVRIPALRAGSRKPEAGTINRS